MIMFCWMNIWIDKVLFIHGRNQSSTYENPFFIKSVPCRVMVSVPFRRSSIFYLYYPAITPLWFTRSRQACHHSAWLQHSQVLFHQVPLSQSRTVGLSAVFHSPLEKCICLSFAFYLFGDLCERQSGAKNINVCSASSLFSVPCDGRIPRGVPAVILACVCVVGGERSHNSISCCIVKSVRCKILYDKGRWIVNWWGILE